MNKQDAIGFKSGRLTVIARIGGGKVRCECECGKVVEVLFWNVKRGKTKSCGCLYLATRGMLKKHGRSKTSEYHIWQTMKARCSNPNSESFSNYGGRGILVCERWLESFENFFADMGKRPAGCTLERIENEGNYEPSNCRWATQSEQCNNTRRNRIVICGGASMTLANAIRIQGFSESTISGRIRRGWSYADAINTPINKKLSRKQRQPTK